MTRTKWVVLAGSFGIGLIAGIKMFPNNLFAAAGVAATLAIVVAGLQTPARDKHIKP